MDLTKDAKGALAAIEDAAKQASEYTDYLKSQNVLLQDAMATIDREMASAAGIDSTHLETKITQQFIAYLSTSISDDTDSPSQIQSDITPDEALQLLKD